MASTQVGRKEILLGLLLVVFVVVFWRNITDDRSSGAGGAYREGQVGNVNLEDTKVFRVPWSLLTAPRPTYNPSGRNIFQFGKAAPPPPAQISQVERNAIDDARRRAEEARAAALARAQAARQQPAEHLPVTSAPARQAPPPPPAGPTPPPIKYKFIGYLGPADNKIAVLHDGTDLLFVSRGEELDNQFRVLDIGYESIKFGFLDPRFKDESKTLPMSGSP